MSILAFPAGLPAPNSMSFGLAANTQSGGRSPFDGTEQTLALPGDRWAAELRWHDLEEPEWRILQGFLAGLQGRTGRFTWAPCKMPRKGDAAAGDGLGPRILAAGQTGKVITTTGWDGPAGHVFRTGDLVGWLNPAGRAQLHMVTADVPSADPTSTNLQARSTSIVPGGGTYGIGTNTVDLGAVADPRGGTSARRLGSTTGTGSNAYLARASTLAVNPGTTYALSVGLRLNAGALTGRYLTVDEYNNGTLLARSSGAPLSGSGVSAGWRRLSRAFTTRPDTNRLQVYWLDGPTTGTEYDVDGCQIEPRATATALIETGATAGTRTQSIAVPIVPAIRRSPNADTPLILVNPAAVWMLTQDRVLPDYEPGPRGFSVTLPIEEAIY